MRNERLILTQAATDNRKSLDLRSSGGGGGQEVIQSMYKNGI